MIRNRQAVVEPRSEPRLVVDRLALGGARYWASSASPSSSPLPGSWSRRSRRMPSCSRMSGACRLPEPRQLRQRLDDRWHGRRLRELDHRLVGAAGLTVALAAPAAYVLSRAEFPGRELLVTGIIAGMGVPAVLLFVPVFMLLARSTSETPPGTLRRLRRCPDAVYRFLLTGFFATLPVELEEAAIVDGASELASVSAESCCRSPSRACSRRSSSI